ncbi:MAG TPA: DUF4007 family protein [Chloroflexia bacterium]|nr:DUF4007 family protein [Chloroflexia bacterium]
MGFAQHQTFHIRDGWLLKGLKQVKENPAIFTEPDAYLKFGLGKNMVEALRFWMRATGLTTEKSRKDGRRIQEPTLFGELVLNYDPYLETDTALWLIHHQLIKQQEEATTWYWFFNIYNHIAFDKEHFVSELSLWTNTLNLRNKEITKGSFERDFDCLLRTYLPRERSISPEDSFESPLVHLNLMSLDNTNGAKRYVLNRPEPRSIPPLVLLYVTKKWQEENQPDAIQVSLRDLLTAPASPGRSFLLGLRLVEALRRASDIDEAKDFAFKVTRTAGLDVLSLPKVSAEEILKQAFSSPVLIGSVL